MRRTKIAVSLTLFLSTPIGALAEDQAITVGPWTIATSSRGDKFDSCTMSRSTNDLDVTLFEMQTDCSSFLNHQNGDWNEARHTLLR